MPPAVAIAGAAVVGGATSIIAGNKAASATKQGAEAAANASREGTALQVDEARRQYDTTRGDFAPYREAGYGALGRLQELYGLPVTSFPGGETRADPSGSSTPWADGYDHGAYKNIEGNAPQGVDWGAYVRSNPDALAQWSNQTPDLQSFGGDINKFGAFHYVNDGSRRDLAPYQQNTSPAARGATGTSGRSPTDIIRETPGYEFRRSEGLRNIQRNAAARGILGSGGTLKALQRYGDGLASSEYDAYANRLAALAGVGQTATGSTAAAGANASNTISNAYGTNAANIANAATNAGNATAAGYANVGSSINSGINNLASAYLYSRSPVFGGSPSFGSGPQGGAYGVNNYNYGMGG